MAIMLNARSNVYENISFSASQPPNSFTISQIAGIAVGRVPVGRDRRTGVCKQRIFTLRFGLAQAIQGGNRWGLNP